MQPLIGIIINSCIFMVFSKIIVRDMIGTVHLQISHQNSLCVIVL